MYIPVWLLIVAVIILFVMVCKVSSQVSGCGELAVSIINRTSILEKQNDCLEAKLNTLSERMEKRFDDESEYIHEYVRKFFEMHSKSILFNDNLTAYNYIALHNTQETLTALYSYLVIHGGEGKPQYEEVEEDTERVRKSTTDRAKILFTHWNKIEDIEPKKLHEILYMIADNTFFF